MWEVYIFSKSFLNCNFLLILNLSQTIQDGGAELFIPDKISLFKDIGLKKKKKKYVNL